MDTLWCHTDAGAVTIGPRYLPRSWRNISNLYALPAPDLLALGWRHYRLVTAPNDTVVTGSTWEITPTEAVETQTWRDKTQTELDAERDDLATQMRDQRNALLAACDWTQLPDAPVDHAAWAAYRQQLRDVTSQPGWPTAIEWPVPPA